MGKWRRRILWALFLIYAAIMLTLLFLRQPPVSPIPYWHQLPRHVNLVPLQTIRLYLNCFRPPVRPGLMRIAAINLAGNVLMFLPLGFFPPLLFPRLRRFRGTLAAAAGIMAAVELAQMLLLVGTCDIDDLILNLVGTALGWCLSRLFLPRRE